MPWTTTFGASRAEVRFTGHSNGEDVCAANRAVFAHRYPEELHFVLVDFARVEHLDLPLADLLKIADQNRQYLLLNPAYSLAVVAPQAHVSGLAHTYERYMEGSALRSKVVHTRDEALAWFDSEMLASV